LQKPVALAVQFKLTDPDYKPLSGVPARLVFGSDPNWQNPSAGQRVVTDAKGEAKLTAGVVLEKRPRKPPTNFADSLLIRPQQTDYLRVGAEIEYMNHHWLYVVDLYRFPKGDVLLDSFSVYTADEKGRFTRKARRVAQDWLMDGMEGLLMTSPGCEPWDYRLDTAPAAPPDKRWTLRLAFKKFPPPVRR
jgi:hypothetical protein